MPVCDKCTMDPCECASYGPGETPDHLQPQCEVCGERPGHTNSRFIFDDDLCDVGVWICGLCEQRAESVMPLIDLFGYVAPDHPDDDPSPIDPYYELEGEYEMDFGDRQWGDYVSPFIDEEREAGSG